MKEGLTPLLHQYQRIKAKYPDAILLFRVGDFYETFYEDAKIASKVLGIVLTQRQEGVPLAGVPYHAVEPYVAKLVRAGYKVAICEQLEEPKPGKLVHRDVVEVITPGTLLEPQLLKERQPNYLMALIEERNMWGVATIDISTGEFRVTEVEAGHIKDEVQKFQPSEIVIPQSMTNIPNFLKSYNLTATDDINFDSELANTELSRHFNVQSVDGFGLTDMPLAIRAAGAALHYVKETKKQTLDYISSIRPYRVQDFMFIDSFTRRNLELTEKITGEYEGSLLSVLDETCTPMGARLLREYMLSPLLDVTHIRKRLDAVQVLYDAPTLLTKLRSILAKLPDMQRLISRINVGRANPRELQGLKRSIMLLPKINELLPQSLSDWKVTSLHEVADIIDKTLVEDPPTKITEGGLIKEGANAELDGLRQIVREGKNWIAQLEARERIRTGIESLKVGYNSVFGYYIEVTKPNLHKVPKDYIRKQTLVNAERFITPELKEYESKVLHAEDRIKDLEYKLYNELRGEVAKYTTLMQEVAKKLAELDVLASLAYVARKYNYVRPEFHEADRIEIVGGRHPVVEHQLKEGEFVPNDLTFDEWHRVLIVTGPNMSGKSTYLRQAALILIMAQMGSFVPAESAHLRIVDRIFTRIGASDDITRGVSTFLAEMNETANILHNATERSLIILDEIGRGTSTFDGLSIAWAVVEYIARNIKACTLFATHYHELTRLADMIPIVKNFYVEAKRYKDRVIFLHRVKPGSSDESYGVDVARLAGLPKPVIQRAKEILRHLEYEEKRQVLKKILKSTQVSLFDVLEESEHPIITKLKTIDVNKLTPIDALLLIKELKESLDR